MCPAHSRDPRITGGLAPSDRSRWGDIAPRFWHAAVDDVEVRLSPPALWVGGYWGSSRRTVPTRSIARSNEATTPAPVRSALATR